MNTTEKIQELLGVEPDGYFGSKSKAAFNKIIELEKWRSVIASSFADKKDIEAYYKCRREGGSESGCFAVGDNGIGKWGDDTTTDEPMCALPREDWAGMDCPNEVKVEVSCNGQIITCRLADTMPSRAKIKNGAGIDLNPGALRALGLKAPIMIRAKWRFV